MSLYIFPDNREMVFRDTELKRTSKNLRVIKNNHSQVLSLEDVIKIKIRRKIIINDLKMNSERTADYIRYIMSDVGHNNKHVKN